MGPAPGVRPYSVRLWASSADPLLKSVPCAYVLTMRDSTRLRQREAAALTRFCGRTYVQTNAGWKRSPKPAWVNSTATDILDAYRNVCLACRDVDAPVLILEDDARLLSPCRASFDEVDRFVRTQPFDVYSLGSVGLFDRRRDVGKHRMFMGLMACSQAVVWSRAAREQFLAMDVTRMTHIDTHAVSSMARKYTYARPLVVQLFPTTDNMSSWCIECKGRMWETVFTQQLVRLMQDGLSLDTKPDGWHTLYFYNNYAQVLVLTAAACVVWHMALAAARRAAEPTH